MFARGMMLKTLPAKMGKPSERCQSVGFRFGSTLSGVPPFSGFRRSFEPNFKP